jgi:hypothetical protein
MQRNLSASAKPALGQTLPRHLTGGAAEILLITDAPPRDRRDCNGPCMDGARVARANLTFCEAFGCSHVYGLFSRGGLPHRDAAAVAAGPDVIRGSGPNQFHAFLPRVAHKRVFPIDGLDRFASMSSSPLQFLNAT